MSTPPPWLRTVDAAGLVDEAGTVRSTIFAEISALATEHGAVNLGQGFPDEDAPREVLDAANADTGVPLTELKVDGGMVANEALMQFQADILGVPVIRPVVAETTALGAAYAAGLAVEFWKDLDELRALWQEDTRWEAAMDEPERARRLAEWHKAVTRTFDWVDPASA